MPLRTSTLSSSSSSSTTKSTNRLSAVYIGPQSQPLPLPLLPSSSSFGSSHAHIPDLPGPPSPSGSPNSNGLPSPPATNSSVGSGGGNDVDVDVDADLGTNGGTGEIHTGSSNSSSWTMSASSAATTHTQPPHTPPSLPFSAANYRGRHRQSSSISSIASLSTVAPRGSDSGGSILEEPEPIVGSPLQDDDAPFEDQREYRSIHDREDDDDNDTARIDPGMLKRMTLKERNRHVLDTLSGNGRTQSQSPVPSISSSSTSSSRRSHARSQTQSTTNHTNHHAPSHSLSNSISLSTSYDPRSGSETERESTYSRASGASTSSSHYSHHRSISLALDTARNRDLRHERERERDSPPPPSSPSKGSRYKSKKSSGSQSGSSGRRRKRASASLVGEGTARIIEDREREKVQDILESTRRRRSPTTATGSGVKRRGALPEEFRRASTESPALYRDSESLSFASQKYEHDRHEREQDYEPYTPHRAPSLTYTTSGSSSHTAASSASASTSAQTHITSSSSSRRSGSTRYSLDLASRSSNSRASYHTHSQSYSNTSYTPPPSTTALPNVSRPESSISVVSGGLKSASAKRTSFAANMSNNPTTTTAGATSTRRTGAGTPILGMSAYRERRQTLRGGSAESALSGTARGSGQGKRTLIGEELRNAGLSPTKDRDRLRRERDRDRDRDRVGERREVGRLSFGNAWEMEEAEREMRRSIGRAVTSMALYSDNNRERDREEDDERDREGGRALRGVKSVAGLGMGRDASLARDERERDRGWEERRLRERDRSLVRDRDLSTPDRDRDRERERDLTYTAAASTSNALMRLRTTTAGTPSPYGSRRLGPSATPIQHTEHTRLLAESLIMFEGHFTRSGLGGVASNTPGSNSTGTPNGAVVGGGGGDVIRNAQGVVNAASRLNELLRLGTARALEEQVRAEVDADGEDHRGLGLGREGERAPHELWGRVGSEYRDALRVSDELVRGLTGLLLGVGRAVKEVGGLNGVVGGEGHGRSVSLDEEGLVMNGRMRRARGSLSPDVGFGGGGGGVPGEILSASSRPGPGSSGAGSASGGGSVVSGMSGSGRRSVESRTSWEPKAASIALREDIVSRRLGPRAESALGNGVRPSSAYGTSRDREKDRIDTPPQQQHQRATTRKLFTAREQREMQMTSIDHNLNHTPASAGAGGMPTIHSQETFYGEYEPSPTPASRTATMTTLDRSRTLPPLGVPKPLPSLPSENALRRNKTVIEQSSSIPNDTPTPAGTVRDRDHERRKPSVASISTVRADANAHTSTSSSTTSSSSLPLTAPPGATTAITPHTVSTQLPDRDRDRERERERPQAIAIALPRTDSDRSVRSSVTFSRPKTVTSVAALADVRALDTRRRTGSGVGVGVGFASTSTSVDPSTSDPLPPTPMHQVPLPTPIRETQSGSETERPLPRRNMHTLGLGKGRLSLDGKTVLSGAGAGAGVGLGESRVQERSVGAKGPLGPPMNTALRRERRRTITDIWPQE